MRGILKSTKQKVQPVPATSGPPPTILPDPGPDGWVRPEAEMEVSLSTPSPAWGGKKVKLLGWSPKEAMARVFFEEESVGFGGKPTDMTLRLPARCVILPDGKWLGQRKMEEEVKKALEAAEAKKKEEIEQARSEAREEASEKPKKSS